MADFSDYELSRDDAPFDAESSSSRRRVWIAVAVGLLLAAVIGGFVYTRRTPPAPPAATVTKPVAETVVPLGGPAESVVVPPLDESDAVVRDLVRTITSNPLVLRWLTMTGLLRNVAVELEAVLEGGLPARQLGVIRPSTPFRVVQRSGRTYIDPASYARYDAFATAADSIDAAAAARVYSTLKQRLAEAYSELGKPPDSLDLAIERSIISLLRTPIVDDPIAVNPKGGTAYEFADARLEGLSPAQKQLLRMGSRNVRVVQGALRKLAVALGIPQTRIP